MSIYLKLMYDQWIQGQSELEIKERWNVFVKQAAVMLCRTEEEVCEELKKSTWFKFDIKSD